MTPALLRSPRPFCAYCDTGLRELCPTRRAIDAGLPGLALANENAYLRVLEAREARRRYANTLTRLDVFRAFRSAGCRSLEAIRALGITSQDWAATLRRLDIVRPLRLIRKASESSRVKARLNKVPKTSSVNP